MLRQVNTTCVEHVASNVLAACSTGHGEGGI